MKVLVTGASGMLGKAVMHELSQSFDVLGTYSSRPVEGMVQLTISSKESVLDLLTAFNPDIIVHLAAIRAPDLCRELTAELQAINTDCVQWLGEWAVLNHRFMVHTSSDSLFDGTSPPYSETSAANPINVYGCTKLQAEQCLSAYLDKVAILRLPVLYSQTSLSESSMTSFLPEVLSQTPMQLDNWSIRFPTAVQDVARAMRKLVETRTAGLYQFSGKHAVTKYSVGLEVCRLRQIDPGFITPVDGMTGSVPRAKDSQLLTSSLFADIETSDLVGDLPRLIALTPAS
jgi:dTDP-4-dehydrorhamnose reductase